MPATSVCLGPIHPCRLTALWDLFVPQGSIVSVVQQHQLPVQKALITTALAWRLLQNVLNAMSENTAQAKAL